MTDAIASSLFYDNLQIAFIAICLVVACALTIYNLPWNKREWGEVMKMMKLHYGRSGTVSMKANLRRRLNKVFNGEQNLYPTQKQMHSGFPIGTESESV